MQRRTSIIWALAIVGALVSQAGAEEQESAMLPSSGSYSVVAVLASGGQDADVFGRDNDPTGGDAFSVGIDSNGVLTVNGTYGGTVNPNGTFMVTVDVTVGPLSTSYVTKVRDSQDELVCQTSHSTSSAPTTAYAEADQVVALAVQ